VVAGAAELPIQGVLRTNTGGPAADGNYIVFVKLYDAPDAPLEVFEEVLKNVELKSGWFEAVLGGLPQKTIPDALLQSGKPLWLGVQVGGDPELPRVPLRGVPLAWHAKAAGALDCTGCVSSSQIADGAVTESKVNFNYAASDSKGGAATLAIKAQAADFAANAAKASTADSAIFADEAGGLQCTACVQVNELSAGVVAAFVSTKGGLIDGNLAVAGKLQASSAGFGGDVVIQGNVSAIGATVGSIASAGDVAVGGKLNVVGPATLGGGLNLGTTLVEGGRISPVEAKKLACDAQQRGRIVFDDPSGRLYLCDGKALLRLSTCSELCKDPALVSCGAAITNDCGDTANCSGSGTACAPNFACKAGKCEAQLACNAAVGKSISFSQNTSWQVPGDVKSVRVLVVGGGGGGATGHGNGGGSGHVRKGTFAVTPCTTLTLTIGQGGATNASGGQSSFGNLLSAQGGSGGQQNASGSGAGGSGGGGAGNSGFGGDGGSNGAAGQNGQTYTGGAGGNFDSLPGFFGANALTAASGGSKGSSSHAGGGGGGGVLIGGAGPGGGNGNQSWSAKGGGGWGGGGGGGGYSGGTYATGGTGASGIIYIEWD
jgi:hypothetical protein